MSQHRAVADHAQAAGDLRGPAMEAQARFPPVDK